MLFGDGGLVDEVDLALATDESVKLDRVRFDENDGMHLFVCCPGRSRRRRNMCTVCAGLTAHRRT